MFFALGRFREKRTLALKLIATLSYRTGFDIIADRSPQSGDFRGTTPWNALFDFGSG